MITRHPPDASRSSYVAHQDRVYLVSTSKISSPSLHEQAVSALKRLDELLAAAGSDRSHVLSVTVYLADIGRKPEFNAAWDAWVVPGHAPQRACVGVQLENEDLVELVAVAALL